MKTFYINLNGTISNGENAKISVLDRGFLYGDSVYEATRTFNKKPLRLKLHIDRLFESANKIYFFPKLSKEHIYNEVMKTITAAPFANANLRIVLTRGTNSDLGLDPNLTTTENLIIYCKELSTNPDWWYEKGVSLDIYQKESSSKGSLPKTGNYIENMLAYRQAIGNGFYDSLMINNDGFITECTTSNIWIIKNNIVYTPSLDEGVLPGLTRATILKMPHSDNYCFKEKRLTLEDLMDASECFITSTTREIVPVTKIKEQIIGNGLPGKITLLLLNNYRIEIEKDLNAVN